MRQTTELPTERESRLHSLRRRRRWTQGRRFARKAKRKSWFRCETQGESLTLSIQRRLPSRSFFVEFWTSKGRLGKALRSASKDRQSERGGCILERMLLLQGRETHDAFHCRGVALKQKRSFSQRRLCLLVDKKGAACKHPRRSVVHENKTLSRGCRPPTRAFSLCSAAYRRLLRLRMHERQKADFLREKMKAASRQASPPALLARRAAKRKVLSQNSRGLAIEAFAKSSRGRRSG